jgi:phytanoyl-CoA hydroxylase
MMCKIGSACKTTEIGDGMTKADEHEFHDNGFAIIPDLLSPAEVLAARQELRSATLEHRDLLEIPIPEDPEADPLSATLCVHHIHKISAYAQELAAHDGIVSRLRSYIGENVKCIQSQLFYKPPGFPGNPWHQDEGPIPTRDRSLLAVWIALDDATLANGCLSVVPGSHRTGYIYPTRKHDRPGEFDFDNESFGFDLDAAVPVELKAGSAIFFNGYLLHGSEPNRSSGTREALTFHYMNAFAPLPWRGQSDYRDFFMVAGEDPYAWKGKSELSVPHLRAWPARSPVGASAGMSPTVRATFTKAVDTWSHDESTAIALMREALRGLDAK